MEKIMLKILFVLLVLKAEVFAFNKTTGVSQPVSNVELRSNVTQKKQQEQKIPTMSPYKTGHSTALLSSTFSLDAKNVPNPEIGIYVVVIFLAVVGLLVIGWVIFLIVRQRRRRLYRQPARDSRLRTDSAANTNFDNPIQFPAATYGNAVI